MQGWIEIFRAGRQTDNRGRTRNWTESDLDKMVETYDPATHEAPVVIGHPKDNGPAYGWTESLKRVGNTLLAKFKQVEPAFAEMVKNGRFKKRSISLYADGSVRHIGFLGAAAPALKGLKDISFNADEDFFEYEEPITQENDDMTKEEFEKKLAEEKQKTAAAEKKAAEFKERAEQSDAKVVSLEQGASQKEIESFIEAGIKGGTILPAWKDQGLAEFMGALAENDGEYEFSEGKKETPAAFFRGFLQSFSAHPLFKQMIKDPNKKEGEDSDFAEEEQLAEEMAGLVNPDG